MRVGWLVIPVAVALVAAGCGSGDKTSKTDKSPTIALFLPESKTTRYEAFDRPLFEAKVKALCPSCKVLYSNADQDAAKQQSQVESALTQGANVLVLDAGGRQGGRPAGRPRREQRKIPVIAYDRLITGIDYDYYVSFNNVRVGEMQGQALLDAMKARGTTAKGKIVMINGSPTDPSSADYKKGAHSVLDGKVKIGRGVRHAGLEPRQGPAGDRAGHHRARPGQRSSACCSANDGMAGGAIAAIKRAGYTHAARRSPARTPSSPPSSGSSPASRP